MTDVHTTAKAGRTLPICTLTERCRRCNTRRTTSDIKVPNRPRALMKAERGMSNSHDWDSLHVIVRHGIHANIDLDTSPRSSARCGCHMRGRTWWLCMYHEGMQDGVDLLMDELLIDADDAIHEFEVERSISLPGEAV